MGRVFWIRHLLLGTALVACRSFSGSHTALLSLFIVSFVEDSGERRVAISVKLSADEILVGAVIVNSPDWSGKLLFVLSFHPLAP